MEDILYDIEEHERLTEEEYEVLFQQFGGQDEDEDEEQQEQQLEDADCWDTLANDCHTTRLTDMQHDVKSANEWTRVVTQIYKNAYEYDGIQHDLDTELEPEPDRDYIQSVLDRIDNNRISHMEQGHYSYF